MSPLPVGWWTVSRRRRVFAVDDLYVDACVMPTSTSQDQGLKLLAAVQQIVERYPGIHISAGVSNVSFDCRRESCSTRFFCSCLWPAALTQPSWILDHQLIINITRQQALLGRDEYTAEYLRAYRQGRFTVAAFVGPA